MDNTSILKKIKKKKKRIIVKELIDNELHLKNGTKRTSCNFTCLKRVNILALKIGTEKPLGRVTLVVFIGTEKSNIDILQHT